MIISLILSLLFASGSGGPFTDPEFERYVKKHVYDHDRRKEILAISKSYKNDFSEFGKNDQKYAMQLEAIFEDRTSTFFDFDDFMMEWVEEIKRMNERTIEDRIAIQNLIKPIEWELIVQEYHEADKKRNDLVSEARQKLEDAFVLASGKAEELISDFDKEQEVLFALDDYKDNFLGLIDIRNSEPFIELSEELRISQDDLILIYSEEKKYRESLFDSYKNLHKVLVKNTDEYEWNKIVKELDKLY